MITTQALLALLAAPALEAPASVAAPPSAPLEAFALQAEPEKTKRLTFLLGGRSLDEDLWEPLDSPFALEANFEWRLRDSFLGFEVGTSIAYDGDTVEGVDIDSSTFELYGGLRATAKLIDGHLQPYLGFGPSLVYTDLSGEAGGFSVSDDDTSFGLYARAGLMWVFDGGFGLGLDYRKLFATDVSLFGEDGDVDFDQLAVSLGFAF